MEKGDISRLSDMGDKQNGSAPDREVERQSPFEETKFSLGHNGFRVTVTTVSAEQKTEKKKEKKSRQSKSQA